MLKQQLGKKGIYCTVKLKRTPKVENIKRLWRNM